LNPQTGWQNFSNTTAFKEATYKELRDLIRRDRNHPSVVAWEASLNESDFTDEWAARAHAIVHEEYPGDQASSAAWKWTRADVLVDASQHGVRNSVDPRPTIIDEYGSWDYGGQTSTSNQPREGGDNAMLIQANNIEDAQSKNMAVSWFSADAYWHYADYSGFSYFGITRDGLVDMYRLPKLSYYLLKSQRDPSVMIEGIDSGPMVFIANQWTATSPTRVRVYSNCPRVSLSLNGTLLETRSPDPGTNLAHPPFNLSLATFTPGTLRADCVVGDAVSRRTCGARPRRRAASCSARRAPPCAPTAVTAASCSSTSSMRTARWCRRPATRSPSASPGRAPSSGRPWSR
jgi:beta-galactosidase